MLKKRTDLALEAREIWNESAEQTTELKGVIAEEYEREGFAVTRVRILDSDGAEALSKPVGTYITVELSGLNRREEDAFGRAVKAVAGELTELAKLSPDDPVLVAGLGNSAITSDAIGPSAVANTMVTRHLVENLPEHFGQYRQVAVVKPGVLGTTGIETAEVIRGVAEHSEPRLIIALDALASRKLSRLCSTVQISDTGIIPGSGVGNRRAAINRDTLGIPVIAIGVPTVVDAGTLASDMLEEAGAGELDPNIFSRFGGGMVVTPKEIDSYVSDISKVLGYAINVALHPSLTIGDINMFLS